MPFEEDEKSPDVWFLDHDYLKNMFAMFRKVNGASMHAHTRVQVLGNGTGHTLQASQSSTRQGSEQQ